VNHPTEAEARRPKMDEDTTHQLRTEETTKDQIGEIKSNTNLEDVTYATRKVTWQDSAGGQNKQAGRTLSRRCLGTNRAVTFSTEESRLLSTVYKSRLLH
jgi:hypothetical protein